MAGTYSEPQASNANHCIECSPGTYRLREWNRDSGLGKDPPPEACETCPAGTISAAPAARNCTDCRAGSYAHVDPADYCSPCAPGGASRRNSVRFLDSAARVGHRVCPFLHGVSDVDLMDCDGWCNASEVDGDSDVTTSW